MPRPRDRTSPINTAAVFIQCTIIPLSAFYVWFFISVGLPLRLLLFVTALSDVNKVSINAKWWYFKTFCSLCRKHEQFLKESVDFVIRYTQCIKRRLNFYWISTFGDVVTLRSESYRVFLFSLRLYCILPGNDWQQYAARVGEIFVHLTGMVCPWAGNLTANFWKMSNPRPMPCSPPAGFQLIGA